MGLAGVRTWSLQVVAVGDITPRMRRVELTGPELEQLEHLPGQDVMLIFPRDGSRPIHRRYTIRRLDRARPLLELNFVMHGDGPAARWARSAEPGTRIDVAGPRGKIALVEDAAWHLFAGDETGLPAALAMMEALPSEVPASGFFVVDGPEEELPPLTAGAHGRAVTWVHRGEAPEVDRELAAVIGMAELPDGQGHAYLAGELGLVATLQRGLEERGLSAGQVSGKPYWNRARANASHGEPERVQ